MAQPTERSSLPDWTSLPKELLETIGKRLASGHDAASFRAACSLWRDAVPFAAFGPLLLLPLDPDSGTLSFYSVTEKKVFSLTLPDVRGKVPCGSSCGWLALMDEAASVTLLNPFTGARVELPPADEHVAAAANASESERMSKVRGRWMLRSGGSTGNASAANTVKLELEDMRGVFFHEIVLSAPPDAGGECVAMAVLASSTEIAVCRVGVDSAWTLLDTKLECSVASIVHCQGKFLAIDVTGEISVLSINAVAAAGESPTAAPLPSLLPPAGLCHRSYLESEGELHLVGVLVRMFHETQQFTYRSMIYKCNLLDHAPGWSRVKDVGDLALFVSKCFSGSFSGASVSKYKRNSIYFSEPLYGDPYDFAHRFEIVDIAAGTSKVKPFRENMQGAEALGWIRPNLWNKGGISKNKENSQTEAAYNVTDVPEPAGEVKASAVQFKNT